MSESFNDADFPAAFGRVVADGIPGILSHQRADGAIIYDERAPIVYPQQAIYPLAYCWAGLDPDRKFHKSPDVFKCIQRLGDYLLQRVTPEGEFEYESYGYKVKQVDQRLTQAWADGLFILREHGADIDMKPWADRIEASCRWLIDHKLKKLVGLRRFIGAIMGTSTNHVALYATTVYRSGAVLGKQDLCDFALPIARALAADVHPDGYWDEHNDLQRTGGPTPLYNYLTQGAMALMYAWTKEDVFAQAIAKSTLFHGRFSYPDALFCDLIDERVRLHNSPMGWGLHGFSHTPEGRGLAALHLKHWLKTNLDKDKYPPEMLARHCESATYWNKGPIQPPLIERPDHTARMSLPMMMARRRGWAIALSGMAATNAGDNAYRENPFGLERAKLFSAWHPDCELVVSGSHSKEQPEAGTFSAVRPAHWTGEFFQDYLPRGGSVGEENGELVARANYRAYAGTVAVKVLSERLLQITLSIDPAGFRGPVAAGFILRPQNRILKSAGGTERKLTEEPVALSLADLGGAFDLGRVRVKGPSSARLQWPLLPFNSYAADHKSSINAAEVRVFDLLDIDRTSATFTIEII